MPTLVMSSPDGTPRTNDARRLGALTSERGTTKSGSWAPTQAPRRIHRGSVAKSIPSRAMKRSSHEDVTQQAVVPSGRMAWRLFRTEVEDGVNYVDVGSNPSGHVEIQLHPDSRVLKAFGEGGWSREFRFEDPAKASARVISANQLLLVYKAGTVLIKWHMRADTKGETVAIRDQLQESGVTSDARPDSAVLMLERPPLGTLTSYSLHNLVISRRI